CDKLQDGVVALLDMTSPRVAPLLRSLSGVAGIAYVSVVDDSYFRYSHGDEDVHFRVEPVSVQMLKVVADIVKREELNNVALVYDDTFDIQNTPRRILTNVPAQHLYVRISNSPTELRAQVDMLREISIKSIFIIANNENAKRFLGEMNKGPDAVFPDLFVLTKDGKLNCEGCIRRMRLVTLMGKTSMRPMKDYIDFIKASDISHDFDSDDIKVDEALSFDLARLIRSAMASNMTPIAYNCSDMNSTMSSLRNQSQQLVDALRMVSDVLS
ncbi:hypothetical protein BaRGS_00019150, partial [Batillaria attramentaria]